MLRAANPTLRPQPHRHGLSTDGSPRILHRERQLTTCPVLNTPFRTIETPVGRTSRTRAVDRASTRVAGARSRAARVRRATNPTAASSGRPTTMITRSRYGTWVSGCRSPRCQARSARYAPPVPSSAPRNASAPAVAPVIVRRVVLVAPVAVSVRSSLAVSLRMRPTVMASTPSATRRPTAVAPSRSPAFDDCFCRVSTVIPAAAAVCRAELIWAVVSGDGVWMNQPAATDFSPNFCERVRGEQRVGRRGVLRKLARSGSWAASGPGLWRAPVPGPAWRRSRGTSAARRHTESDRSAAR